MAIRRELVTLQIPDTLLRTDKQSDRCQGYERPLQRVLDQILPRLHFLSIGTNDLTQFLFAADRGNPRLAERYDWLSPAILRFLSLDS